MPSPPSVAKLGLGPWSLSFSRRREYHDLMNIAGISTVIRNGKTADFSLSRGAQKSATFTHLAAKRDHSSLESELLFMFLPHRKPRKGYARVAGLCSFKDISFPACCPVIQAKSFCLLMFLRDGKN